NRYHIRRELGESWIPADKVLLLCASRAEAFQFLRGRTNLRDADERLKLARWCQVHGMQEQGLVEVKAALELKPNNTEARRLLRCFERNAEPTTPTPQPETSASPPADPSSPILNAGLTMEAASLFATRVQPI